MLPKRSILSLQQHPGRRQCSLCPGLSLPASLQERSRRAARAGTLTQRLQGLFGQDGVKRLTDPAARQHPASASCSQKRKHSDADLPKATPQSRRSCVLSEPAEAPPVCFAFLFPPYSSSFSNTAGLSVALWEQVSPWKAAPLLVHLGSALLPPSPPPPAFLGSLEGEPWRKKGVW